MHRPERLFEIDLLRGFAILLVLFRHTHYSLPVSIGQYPWLLQGTWSGVDLFFTLSGFVITLSLVPMVEASRAGAYRTEALLRAFFARRALRLLPLSLLTLGASLLLARVFNASGQFGEWSTIRGEILPVLLNYYNYHAWLGGSGVLSWYWSLAIEEQFYAVFPFVLLALRTRRAQALAFAAGIALITFVIRPFFTPDFAAVNHKLWPAFTTPSHLRFDTILAGCLAGLLWLDRGPTLTEFARRHRAALRAAAWTGLATIALAAVLLPRFELTCYPVIIAASTALTLIAAAGAGATPTLGLPAALNWIGRRSYAIYLVHMPMIRAANELWFRATGLAEADLSMPQGLIGLAAALLATGVAAEALARTVESPGIEAGRRWSTRILSGRSGGRSPRGVAPQASAG
jgi:peptidoglycan/LPS O-acetylase OafA/YrhL